MNLSSLEYQPDLEGPNLLGLLGVLVIQWDQHLLWVRVVLMDPEHLVDLRDPAYLAILASLPLLEDHLCLVVQGDQDLH